jgi:hypothetical protein
VKNDDSIKRITLNREVGFSGPYHCERLHKDGLEILSVDNPLITCGI